MIPSRGSKCICGLTARLYYISPAIEAAGMPGSVAELSVSLRSDGLMFAAHEVNGVARVERARGEETMVLQDFQGYCTEVLAE